MSSSQGILGLDPLKEAKLEERISRAPGALSQIGFSPSPEKLVTESRPEASLERKDEPEAPSVPNSSDLNETPPILHILSKRDSSLGGLDQPPAAEKEEEDDDTVKVMDEEEDEEFISLVQDGKSPQRTSQDSPSKSDNDGQPAGNSTKRIRFTPDEDEALIAKHQEHGPNWKLIIQETSILSGRTPGALSRRYTTLSKKSQLSRSSSTQAHITAPDIDRNVEEDEVQIIETTTSNPGMSGSQASIAQFFRSSGNGDPSSRTMMSVSGSQQQHSRPSRPASPHHPSQNALLQSQKEENQKLQLELERARREKQEAQQILTLKEQEYEKSQVDMKSKLERARELLKGLIQTHDEQDAIRIRKQCSESCFRIGKITVQRGGISHNQLKETWEDGHLKRELNLRGDQILKAKGDLEKSKQNRNKKRGGPAEWSLESELEDRALDEVRSLRLAQLKQDEAQLAEDRSKFHAEKALHMRELKRVRDEDSSCFAARPALAERYQLRALLGKGGFSEVWKGFDLCEMRDVAIKIHELDTSWSEERRRNYAKHAKREYEIHLALRHPRIVQLYDVIEINHSSSFATVLEFCSGTDLDAHLKKHRTLPEKEAKAILMQVLSGLLCLSNGGGVKDSNSIIHFDIKPANILFDGEGGVKLTDFGLSKIVQGTFADDTTPGVELTSQGAGTYWYLPPECFIMDRRNPPKITNKVDVWSTGVVFYQMLFGKRPFGEGLSQESLLKNQTMLNATRVEFPTKPTVSEGAKDFIRRCLTHCQQLRPDVDTICQDPYLRPGSSKKRTSAHSTDTTPSSV